MNKKTGSPELDGNYPSSGQSRLPPLWTDLWQTGTAILGANLAIVFGIFSILQWQIAQLGVDESRAANQLSLIQICVGYNAPSAPPTPTGFRQVCSSVMDESPQLLVSLASSLLHITVSTPTATAPAAGGHRTVNPGGGASVDLWNRRSIALGIGIGLGLPSVLLFIIVVCAKRSRLTRRSEVVPI